MEKTLTTDLSQNLQFFCNLFARDGAFRKLWIAEDARPSVVEEDLWVDPGDPVEAFSGASKAVGTLVMNWPSEEERDTRMADISAWARILTEGEADV